MHIKSQTAQAQATPHQNLSAINFHKSHGNHRHRMTKDTATGSQKKKKSKNRYGNCMLPKGLVFFSLLISLFSQITSQNKKYQNIKNIICISCEWLFL